MRVEVEVGVGVGVGVSDPSSREGLGFDECTHGTLGECACEEAENGGIETRCAH